MDEDRCRHLAKYLGMTLTRGTLKPCEACAESKAKRKAIAKTSEHQRSNEVNGWIYLDISTIKKPKNDNSIKRINQANWRLMIDEKTQLKFTDFYQTKNGMIEPPTCAIFQKWKDSGKPVKTKALSPMQIFMFVLVRMVKVRKMLNVLLLGLKKSELMTT